MCRSPIVPVPFGFANFAAFGCGTLVLQTLLLLRAALWFLQTLLLLRAALWFLQALLLLRAALFVEIGRF